MRNVRLVLLICCFAALQLHAAFTAYLYLDGIPGEVADASHQKWIAVDSFSDTQVASLTTPGFQASSLDLTKPMDKASPLLALYVANHANIPNAHLQLVKSSDGITFYDLQMSNVTVSALSQSGALGSDNGFEQFILNFTNVSWTYTIDTGGTVQGTVSAQWPPAMALSITYDPQTSTVKFTWPVSSTPFTLQQNGDLKSNQWTTVPNSPTVVGNQNQVVVPVSSLSAQFYRLKY